MSGNELLIMKKILVNANGELLPEIRSELLNSARNAMDQAYSPYSNFRVGAAVLTGDGEIYRGCNVENASYGLTVCAERVAIFNAVSDGKMDIVAVAVATMADRICKPCGACRQVIAEFSKAEQGLVIFTTCATGEVVEDNITGLLPDFFTLL